jgi:hypothetical protein
MQAGLVVVKAQMGHKMNTKETQKEHNTKET